jgi:hypothetical protein
VTDHEPYTYVTTIIQDGVARLGIDFHTSDVLVQALRARDIRPFLHLSTPEAQVTFTTTGGGPVTEQDVTLAREIFNAAVLYLADCERLRAEQPADSSDTADGVAA